MRHYGRSALLVPKDSKTFSVLNRPKPNYPGHVPLNKIERLITAVGSGFISLYDPRRADQVAAFIETTAGKTLLELRDTMLSDPTGRRILKDRPQINSRTMPIEYLQGFPEGTLGRYMADYLIQNRMSLDMRDNVRYVDHEELAYVMLRYRQGHDFLHALLGLPATYRETEVAVKAFEYANTGLRGAGLSLLYVLLLKPEERSRFFNVYAPWAIKYGITSKSILTIYWEEELGTPVEVLLEMLGIKKPPDVRELRKADRRPAKGGL